MFKLICCLAESVFVFFVTSFDKCIWLSRLFIAWFAREHVNHYACSIVLECNSSIFGHGIIVICSLCVLYSNSWLYDVLELKLLSFGQNNIVTLQVKPLLRQQLWTALCFSFLEFGDANVFHHTYSIVELPQDLLQVYKDWVWSFIVKQRLSII